jgi:hypothetical protein
MTAARVLARELTLAEVVATHATAPDAQIRVLGLRRSVLVAVAAHHANPEEFDRDPCRTGRADPRMWAQVASRRRM